MKNYCHQVIRGEIQGITSFLLKGVLRVLSWGYFVGLQVRAGLYVCGLFRPSCLPRPVISVGNLTVGGTGKSPLVAYLGKALKAEGRRPAVLMRGYMPDTKNLKGIDSDEAVMLRQQLDGIPIVVGANRYQQATSFLKEHDVDCFILDDGFQHRQLKRDVDIVVIDATNPWGGALLPRGLRREPMNALKRAGIIVVTKVDLASTNSVMALKQRIQHIVSNVPIIESRHQATGLVDGRTENRYALNQIKGQNILAFCGIGAPQGFFDTLKKCGAHVQEKIVFEDHHHYEAQDILALQQRCCQQQIKILVTTAKDMVKVRRWLSEVSDDIQVLSLNMVLDITQGKDILLERIHAVLFD